MELCKKENNSKQNRVVKKIKKEETPDWFNKQINQNEATSEDIAKLEERLKNL